MATKTVSSKDPRVQAALDARRKRVAERTKAKQGASSKPKAPAQERTRGITNIIKKRASQAMRVSESAKKGK